MRSLKTPLKGALLAGLALSLISGPAHADRRTSLAGNQLIKDRDDSFIYPQAMLRYNNTLSFDYGASETDGNALLIAGVGKSAAFGVALHRGDITAPIGGLFYLVKDVERGMLSGALPLAPNAYGAPSSIADLMYAMKLGGNSLGFRLGFTSVGDITTPGDGKDAGTTGFGVRLSAGYSIGNKADFVLDFANTSGANITESKNTNEYSILSAHLGGRYRVKQNKAKTLKMVALVDFSFMSTSDAVLTEDKDPAETLQEIYFMAGFGPSYTTKDKKLKVAFYATAGFASTSHDQNTAADADDDSSTWIVFPGFNMALEYAIRDWLYFRSGVVSAFSMLSESFKTMDGMDSVVETTRQTNGTNPLFGWNAGLGVKLDRFKFDATLNHGFITNGPAVLSGASTSGMMALVSATVNFGDAKRVAKAEERPAEPKKD